MKEKIKEDRGIKYETIEMEKEIEATCSFEDKRIVFTGILALEKMSNSWKFGKQIQIVLFGKNIKIEHRSRNNGNDRIEIAIPFVLGEELLRKFIRLIDREKENHE
jgi:hypothetical protein